MTDSPIQTASPRKFFGFALPDLGLAALLLLAVLVLYWPVTHADFVYLDDGQYVQTNPYVQQGLSLNSVYWALTNPIMGNWHPLTMWSYMLDYEIFGLNPGGFHLTNLLFHAVDTALAFLVFYRLTGARGRSWFVAALFGLHPLHVESVAWIAERKDVLSAFFWLLAMGTYVRQVECAAAADVRAKKYHSLTLLFFVLGLMSKSMLVTLPCVFLLLDFWPLKRFPAVPFRRLVTEKIPFFAVAAAASVLTFLFQKRCGATTFVDGIPFAARLQNALVSYGRYLGKFFWPENLAIFYPHPKHWPLGAVLLAVLLLVAVTAFVYGRRKPQPFLLVGWLWFVGTLVPVIGLVQVGGQAMADRYTYLPSLGFFVLMVWGGYELLKNYRQSFYLSLALGVVALGFCSLKTRQQLPYWQNMETISRHALAVTQDNYIAHQLRGVYFASKDLLDDSAQEFQATITLKPDYDFAYYNLGVVLSRANHCAAAIRALNEAIRLKPDLADAHYSLGFALFNHGEIAAGIAEYREAVRLQPVMLDSFNQFCALLDANNIAWKLATSPNPAERDGAQAVSMAESACEKTEYHVTIFLGTLAAAYAEAGRFDEAVATAQKACKLASECGDVEHLKKNQELLARFQAHRPYRDVPPPRE